MTLSDYSSSGREGSWVWSGREGLRLGLALELRGPQRGRGVVRVGRADGRNGAWLRGVKRGPEPGVVVGGAGPQMEL